MSALAEAHVAYDPNAIDDDLDLLNLMLADSRQAPEIYRPTNFWDFHERRALETLSTEGLAALCGQVDWHWATSMGAVDMVPDILFQTDVLDARSQSIANVANTVLTKLMHAAPDQTFLPYRISLNDLRETAFRIAQLYGRTTGATPVEQLNVSNVGFPADRFAIGDNHYTYRDLIKYLDYAYCGQFFDFNAPATIVELGGGGGRQAYVLKSLHPQLTLLDFDLPIQLYCCEQFLKKSFPDDVVSYRETRDWKTIPQLEAGKIYMVGAWQFPLLSEMKYDLFWNFASLQEMEPDIVANYLSIVSQGARNVFLGQNLDGMPEGKPGELNVLKKVTRGDYTTPLSGMTLRDESDAYNPLSRSHSYVGDYTWMFFSRS